MNIHIDQTIYLYAVKPLIMNIVRDIILSFPKDKDLDEVKQKLCSDITRMIHKDILFFNIDVEEAVNHIMLSPDNFQKLGHILIDAVQIWVLSSNTHWEHEKISPVVMGLKCIQYGEELNFTTLEIKPRHVPIIQTGLTPNSYIEFSH